MERLVIKGGYPLSGEIEVHGAKNSALPILAATILGGGISRLYNCPCLSDIDAACEILTFAGCPVTREEDFIEVDSASITNYDIPENFMSEMRSSIIFLGALIARCGRARMCHPGGCDIGLRPINLHLEGLRKLGVRIEEEYGILNCYCERPLKGARISLPFPSVGATENIMLAAVTAEGETLISNAAAEPEIVDLANYLNKCGAKIRGAGENIILIQGVKELHGANHRVIPDRIVAATYLCAAAITGGELFIKKADPNHMAAVIPALEETGCRVLTAADYIYIKSAKKLCPLRRISTMPYPGFPTDAAAPMMALAAVAEGTSVFIENIFENRFKYASELSKMGADISVEGKVGIVEGVNRIFGAHVKATDLRGGAALVLAGLKADGVTMISELGHIDRGYERIEDSLSSIGAKIYRE